MTTLLPAKKKDVLELGELWPFVYCKDFKRWVWIVLCRRTRQIVSFFIGDRSEQTCRRFWELVPPDYRKCRTFSGFWEAYAAVIDTGKHTMSEKNPEKPLMWNAGTTHSAKEFVASPEKRYPFQNPMKCTNCTSICLLTTTTYHS